MAEIKTLTELQADGWVYIESVQPPDFVEYQVLYQGPAVSVDLGSDLGIYLNFTWASASSSVGRLSISYMNTVGQRFSTQYAFSAISTSSPQGGGFSQEALASILGNLSATYGVFSDTIFINSNWIGSFSIAILNVTAFYFELTAINGSLKMRMYKR